MFRLGAVAAAFLATAATTTASTQISFPGELANVTEIVNGTEGRTRSGKNLLHWIDSFGNAETDPFVARANAACLTGDLAECFKAKSLSALDDFFHGESFRVNANARIVRMPEEQFRRLRQETYEYSEEPKAEEPEWDLFVKFLSRKAERFVKTYALQVELPDDVTEGGRYAPRFVDEINSELDAIEDKKASVFTRAKLKKLLIPILLVLKIFKLKLLLFLPFILGLATFKKFLGLLAIAIPGLIGFYKLCKPDLMHNTYGNFGHSSYYHRPPHHYQEFHNRQTESPDVIQYIYDKYSEYKTKNPDRQPSAAGAEENYDENGGGRPIAFKEDGQHLAYAAALQPQK